VNVWSNWLKNEKLDDFMEYAVQQIRWFQSICKLRNFIRWFQFFGN
jgi:hypothetical protein